jgi:RNA polymerase sigma-70 factor (ECF subfamily)
MESTALATLYAEYQPELLRSLQRRFPWSSDIVEDAVQHAFLKLHEAPLSPEEPRAWLRTVARRYIIDHLRATGKLAPEEAAIEQAGPPTPAGDASTSAALPSPTLVQRALLQLTTRARRLLRGKYENGLTYGTLARQEGLAKSGMGRILDRARQRLRRAVEELRRQPGRDPTAGDATSPRKQSSNDRVDSSS